MILIGPVLAIDYQAHEHNTTGIAKYLQNNKGVAWLLGKEDPSLEATSVLLGLLAHSNQIRRQSQGCRHKGKQKGGDIVKWLPEFRS